MNKYTLSEQAQIDLEDLIDFSIFHFGDNQTEEYFEGLIKMANQLSINPYLGRNRSEIKEGLFSFNHRSHTIYYAILPVGIRVIRILHQSRDWKDLF